MSDQEFCRYCGRDTRANHRDDCPSDELDALRKYWTPPGVVINGKFYPVTSKDDPTGIVFSWSKAGIFKLDAE